MADKRQAQGEKTAAIVALPHRVRRARVQFPDNSPMQLLIPYALVDAPACKQALAALQLPHLNALLRRLTLSATHQGSDNDLSMPHEKALARAAGLSPQDGRIPLAALALAASGTDPGQQGWAWITPAHWQIATNQIQMRDPAALELQQTESRALLDALAPYFSQDGIALRYLAPERWLASGQALANLTCASLDRAIGTDVHAWMPASADMRRLQNEMQMLLYTHPVNDARSARGLDDVNSFWISGGGQLGTANPAGLAAPVVADGLRQAALNGDWSAWAQAWSDIDASRCHALLSALDAGRRVKLVLCSRRNAIEFESGASGWMDRLQRLWRRPSLHSLADQL